MNVLKRKLNNQKGASITWALLIFLVCAVVGSAVLVAGTAAAGRMSEAAKNDQRYYAVNSAVRLLSDMGENKKVTVKVVKKTGQSPSCTIDGTAVTTVTSGTTPVFSSFTDEAAYQLIYVKPTDPIVRTFILSTAVTAIADAVSVNVQETIRPDGSLEFVVYKTEDGEPLNFKTYALKVTYALDKTESSVLTGTADEDQVETVTTELTWKMNDIETIEHRPAITTPVPEVGE